MFTQVRNKIRRLSQQWKKKAIVLCYHRIANEAVDPWNIAVSPKNFEEQLQVLANDFNVVSVSDLIAGFDSVATKKSVCISFDDGYTDNYKTAQPLLRKYNHPACFFIASSFIGTEQLFWWDELADIILTAPALPSFLSLQIEQKPFSFELSDCALLHAADKQKIAKWKYYEKVPNERCSLFLQLWEILRPLTAAEQKKVMYELRTWSNSYNGNTDLEKLPMTELQLKELGSSSLFSIGLHTQHHAALGYHSSLFQEQEILENQMQLQNILNKKINIVSFPYGSYNSDSLNLVKKHALEAGFTSEKRIMTKQSDTRSIGRYAVKDWNGAEFKKRLSNWFSKT